MQTSQIHQMALLASEKKKMKVSRSSCTLPPNSIDADKRENKKFPDKPRNNTQIQRNHSIFPNSRRSCFAPKPQKCRLTGGRGSTRTKTDPRSLAAMASLRCEDPITISSTKTFFRHFLFLHILIALLRLLGFENLVLEL